MKGARKQGCASGLCGQRFDDRATALQHIGTIGVPNQCWKKACKGGILKMACDRNTRAPSWCMQCAHRVEQPGELCSRPLNCESEPMIPKLIRDFISFLNERHAQTRLGFMSYSAGLASTTHFCTLPATCCTAMLKQHRGPRGTSEMLVVVVARRPSKLDAAWS